MVALLSMIGGILFLDLVLSGDNTVIIGAAAAGLPQRQRAYAILVGGAGAIALRIVFTVLATLLLNITGLQTLGAVILLILAVRLLPEWESYKQHTSRESDKGNSKRGQDSQRLRSAILTILAADLSMSLDNVLAVGALANGDIIPLTIGLFFSIAIILAGSAIVAELMTRFTWLIYGAVLVLTWTSASMLRDDIRGFLAIASGLWGWVQLTIFAVAFGIVFLVCIILRIRIRHQQRDHREVIS